MAYLDHCSSTLPSKKQTELIANDLLHLNFSNPHSRHSISRNTREVIARTRLRILRYFNTTSDEYSVIFTSGSTDSLRIVAETFDFGDVYHSLKLYSKPISLLPGSFVYFNDSHTSLVGMRELITERCSHVCVMDYDDLQHILSVDVNIHSDKTDIRDLFALTAMSNFCGRKYPLEIIERIHEWRSGRSYVCLDAASLVITSPLDLSIFKPDYIAISFYKMFGLPTGIGALIVRQGSEKFLKKRYFGGGTVKLAVPNDFVVRRRDSLSEWFEDGTLNYWGIAALEHGFKDLESFGGIQGIQQLTFDLTEKFFKLLDDSKHTNGARVAEIYRAHVKSNIINQGAVVTFNLLRNDGSVIGYSEVEKMCELFDISVRAGCFCNQGACQYYLKISEHNLLVNYERGKICGDTIDIIDGKPVGAIRVSFGRQSSIEDVKHFEKMLQTCFINTMVVDSTSILSLKPPGQELAVLTDIFIYPIKSCARFQVDHWPIAPTGLQFDRTWTIVSDRGTTLTQLKCPRLCILRSKIKDDHLHISSEYADSSVSVPITFSTDSSSNLTNELQVCYKNLKGIDCGDEVADWISEEIEMNNCRLLKFGDSSKLVASTEAESKTSFMNAEQYLLINKRSVAELASIVDRSVEEILSRFRANFVVDDIEPFSEDSATRVIIGQTSFKVVSKCARCQMICIDQETGQKEPDLLITLKQNRPDAKTTFGIYLQHEAGNEGVKIDIGMPVILLKN